MFPLDVTYTKYDTYSSDVKQQCLQHHLNFIHTIT